MKILSFFQNKTLEWKPYAFPVPWAGGRPSIYEVVAANPHADLPDDELRFGADGIRWAGGALDNLMGGGGETEVAADVYGPLKSFIHRPTAKGLEALYTALLKANASGYIDRLMDYMVDGKIDRNRLQLLFEWICLKAPDREPVKIGIAMLGICRNTSNADIFHTLGRNDEFTQYALVSLINTYWDPEPAIWQLAKSVDGWGKINAVERLAQTTNPEIKKWLIQDGCRNSIMDEYLAYVCATTGDLIGVLKSHNLDEKTLNGAADIIEALFAGGPARDMSDYEDGAEALGLFVGHLDWPHQSLRLCASLARIHRYLSLDEQPWQRQPGWTPEFCVEQKQRIDAILSGQSLASRIKDDLLSSDNARFYYAITLAEYLGEDLWPVYWERQNVRLDSWWYLMRTEDPSRIDQVLELARQQLDLHGLASGPTTKSIVRGDDYAPLSAIDCIATGLSAFPGRGVDFVIAALKSPPIRNRNMAVKTLAAWKRENWPANVDDELRTALENEPDTDVSERMARVLNGQPFELTTE